MVRYADDFVILCRTEDEAEAALREIGAWTAVNGLTLHPDKTRVADSRQPGQGFEFLGYRFEAGHRFVRKKSLKALKDKVRAKTKRSRGDSLARIIADLNPALRDGLATSNTPRRLCSETSIVSFGDGCAPFCASRTSGPASDDAKPITYDGPTPTSKKRTVHLLHSPRTTKTPPMRKPTTGEPYAGEPHVRFGGGEAKSLPYPYREGREG